MPTSVGMNTMIAWMIGIAVAALQNPIPLGFP
jgi:hypothetical protein